MQQRFTMPGQPMTFTLPSGPALYILVAIIIAGTFTLVGTIIGVLYLAAQLLLLCISAMTELFSQIATLYVSGDSLFKLIIWLLVIFALIKISPFIARSVRRSLASW
jgi:hypothetical protein